MIQLLIQLKDFLKGGTNFGKTRQKLVVLKQE